MAEASKKSAQDGHGVTSTPDTAADSLSASGARIRALCAIEHISDTALLVAAARAAETELEDGLVRDPYARRLAGERRIALAQSGTPSRWRSFGIGLRSRFIDEFLISEVQSARTDCVLCLGAGLDARPWRLPLPSGLRWIEVDFAPILDYKHEILKDEAPHCRLERLVADLSDKADRGRVFETALAGSSRVLLLTEGLLFYLPGETVRSLAEEAVGCDGWIVEISPKTSFLTASGGDAMRQINELRSETRLEGGEILNVIHANGWKALGSKTFVKDGRPFAIQRMAMAGWTPGLKTPRLEADDPAGVWLLQRQRRRA